MHVSLASFFPHISLFSNEKHSDFKDAQDEIRYTYIFKESDSSLIFQDE